MNCLTYQFHNLTFCITSFLSQASLTRGFDLWPSVQALAWTSENIATEFNFLYLFILQLKPLSVWWRNLDLWPCELKNIAADRATKTFPRNLSFVVYAVFLFRLWAEMGKKYEREGIWWPCDLDLWPFDLKLFRELQVIWVRGKHQTDRRTYRPVDKTDKFGCNSQCGIVQRQPHNKFNCTGQTAKAI